ncbi:helix-turn-helix domain-containing protein [uncultured Allomuricauda sp.]|uniref:helix-turn-helix domain-containing protein n=1 Tax=Flagellimonas sp. W118 TaxID=3410791 RepID=UPI002607D4BB|nr:helix-turn-helix domain-containing protein [uncultured Allomuricauda sp.]
MVFNVDQLSLLFIAFQSFMFSIILFSSHKSKRLSSILLASFLLVLSLQMTFLLIYRMRIGFEGLQSFLCVFGFFYGPLLYAYTQSLIFKDFILKPKAFLHLIPGGIMQFSALVGFGLCSKGGSLMYISLTFYTVMAIKSITRYRRIVKQTQSLVSRINLSWLQWILVVFTVTFLIDIYQHFYSALEIIKGLSLVNLCLLVLINGMFFRGIQQPIIFQGISKQDEMIIESDETSREDNEEKVEIIKSHMNKARPFQNSRLTLRDLAEQLQIPPKQLSQIINKQLDQNFVDFINSYRLNMATERLLKPRDDKETILEVMYEVGFNSKSSFNTLFKAKTGKTPTEFKKMGVRFDL